MSNHTPEPWGWRFFGPHLALVGNHSDIPIILDVTPKGVVRMRVNGSMRPIVATRECDDHPDLRLIKSAPSLLMALEMAIPALEWCEKQWANSPQKGDGANVLQFAHAAIAYAKGGDA